MLNTYLLNTRNLLSNPTATSLLYTDANLKNYINIARAQLAGEAECIRVPASLSISGSSNSYPFSSITFSPPGIKGPLGIRMCSILTGGTVPILLEPRPFEWMFSYYLAGGSPVATGTPVRWAQQGQGASGTLYFNPTPNAPFTVTMDVSALPIDLIDDTTAEAIPYPWTDAVPYFAAYYALMSSQRREDANVMYQRYSEFVHRGRGESTPTVMPTNMPGGVGAKEAAMKTSLTTNPGR